MCKETGNKKSIPESRIAWIAGAILLVALVLYVLNMLLPKSTPDASAPTNTPATTPITDENGVPQPIDCYVPDISGCCEIFISADGKSALVDGGYPEDAPAVIDKLLTLGIKKLDLAFLTSADAYTLGGMAEVLTAIPADSFYYSAHMANDPEVSSLAVFLEQRGTKVYAVHADYVSTVEWAKNAELRILSPYNAEYENDADNGLVLRLSYGDSGIMILGKAGALAERMMVKALPNRLLHTDVIFLTETDGSQAPYDKFFKVSKADRYVMKSFLTNSGAVSALQSFIDKQSLARIEIGRGLHLVLDGVDIQVVE